MKVEKKKKILGHESYASGLITFNELKVHLLD